GEAAGPHEGGAQTHGFSVGDESADQPGREEIIHKTEYKVQSAACGGLPSVYSVCSVDSKMSFAIPFRGF
ncbi:MAG: hypothetical protein IJJ26_02510, partial [Victivallales bacterium]|nr:hypothetical protein [Victivallales bacterium]